MITGWGDMDNNKNFPSLLRAVQVPIIPYKVCLNLFENWKANNYKGRVYYGNICAGAPLKDSCTVIIAILHPRTQRSKFKTNQYCKIRLHIFYMVEKC